MLTFILLLFFFIMAAFFSGAEMAFVSCNRIKIRKMASEKDPKAMLVEEFQENPKKFLAALLIANNLAHVGVVAVTTALFEHQFGGQSEWVITLATAPILIVFGENIPKVYCRQKASQIIYQVAPVLGFFYHLFLPLSSAILKLGDHLAALFGQNDHKSPFVTKEEFAYLIEEQTRQGVIAPEEKRLVEMILNFEQTKIDKIMLPIEQVPQVEMSSKVSDLKKLAQRTSATFAVIYEEIPSLVVGVVHVFDILFEKNEDRSLTPYLRSPVFLSKNISAERAFLRLQKQHQSFALVVDEDREVVGLVSMDHLLAF